MFAEVLGVFVLQRYWTAGKAITFFSPYLVIICGLPLLVSPSDRPRWTAVASLVFLITQVGLGIYRPFAAANPTGIHYNAPYPSIQNALLKTKYRWDVDSLESELKHCSLVEVNLPDPFLEHFRPFVLI